MDRSFYVDKYRLFYEVQSGETIQVAHSEDLAKLIKIREVTFNGWPGKSYVLKDYDTDSYERHYGFDDLQKDEREKVRKFLDKVHSGKYYASYDYRQRLRNSNIWC